MKLALKMTLCIVVLSAVLLSSSGYFMLQKSFDDSLQTVVKQCQQQQLKEKFALERQLFTEQNADIKFSNYAAVLAAQGLSNLSGSGGTLALYVDDNVSLFSNMPVGIGKNIQLAAIASGEAGYSICENDGTRTLLLVSALDVPSSDYKLLSAYDITSVFASRDAQLKALFYITPVSVLAAALLAHVLSTLLTRPLARLEAASRQIAAGDINNRTNIRTADEIGSLSESFDAMASSIEDKITSLDAAVREREDFVSAFTHELKTPMTSMLGYAAILRAKQTDDTTHMAAEYIYHETKRLEQLSQKLMLLMGLKNEKITLEPTLSDSVFAAIDKNPPQKDSAVSLTFKPCGYKVLCDKVLLEDMLRNLIVNAQHACREKGEVVVFCEKSGDKCTIFVKDTGCGIEKAEIEKLAQPFYMVDKSRARAENGSGMGLALCSRIAALHGSQLKIESEKGEGTSVSVALSAAREGENEQA